MTDYKKGIKVAGHVGTWYVIDEMDYAGIHYFILESELFGDEAACLAINAKTGELVLEDIWNGVEDLREFLEDK